MKKIFQSFLVFSVLFFSSSYAATADSYPENATSKLGNGAANAVSGLVEIPKNVMIASREEGPLYGIWIGSGHPAYSGPDYIWSIGHSDVHDSHPAPG